MDDDRLGPPGEITGLLTAWRGGDKEALDRLFGIVYRELKSLARRQIHWSPGAASLNTTGLVHETYLRLADRSGASVHDRHHFMALASKAMRHVLIDRARRRRAAKRGDSAGEPLSGDGPAVEVDFLELLAVHDALERLEAADPRLGQLVELRYFGGLSDEEAAAVLGTSTRTVRRDWQKARAFLYGILGAEGKG